MSFALGTRLGAYELLSLLGAGGMGEVYLAYDPRLGRNVAIKVLPAEFTTDAGRLRRFEQEARAAAGLSHPNIVAVHDVGRHAGVPFIVMEYVRGETLSALLGRERLSCARALEIASEIAEALVVAHGCGVMHRDLKPGNVMITPDGHVKVVDFGLAKNMVLESATTTLNAPPVDAVDTQLGQFVGTPGYISPEQRAGHRVDHRTDIYSFGVMLLELVTGQPPFAGEAFDREGRAALIASAPAGVNDLITRAMAIDPFARPQSAAELKTELERIRRSDHAWLSSRPSEPLSRTTESPPVPTASEIAGSGRKHTTRLVVWAVVTAIAVAIVAVPVWRRGARKPLSSTERPVIAVLPLTNLSGDDSKAYLGVGIADTLTTSLGQLSSVSVVSRSTMQEAGVSKKTDTARIARDLGANLLVQGSLQQSGDRLRVNAKLVAPDGRVIWSGDSEGGITELFALENRLAGLLIEALPVTVSSDERQRLARPPTSSREALDAYWQGLAMLDRANDASLDGAISSLQRATAVDSRFSLAHAALGEAFRRKSVGTNDPGLMTKAMEEVSDALRLDSDQPEVHLSLANVYRSTGRNGAAVDELRRALAEQPSNDDAHRQLGDLLASEGRPEEALAELQRAVALRPQYWRNHQQLGLFYLRSSRLSSAIAAFTRLTELKPDDVSPYQQLGAAYQLSGDLVHARENYERSISISPNPGSYANLGMIQYSEGHFDAAARSYEQAVRLAPNRALYRRNLGDVYLKLKRIAESRAAYERAVQLAEEALSTNPSDATTMSQLGVYEAKLGKRGEADRHARGAIAINPASPEVLYRRAVVLALNGDAERAVDQVSGAISKGYSRRLALEDDDLASLRLLPTFQALVAVAR